MIMGCLIHGAALLFICIDPCVIDEWSLLQDLQDPQQETSGCNHK